MTAEQHDYVLPLTEEETTRLHAQAHVLDRFTNPLLARYVRPGMHCVEIGCGLGASTQTIREILGRTGKLTTVDQGDAYLNYTRNRLAATGNDGVDFVKGTAETHAFEPGSDLVFGRAVLHHTRTPGDIFARAAASLSPGGFVIFQEPTISAAIRGHHPAPMRRYWELYSALGEALEMSLEVGDDLAGFARTSGLEILELSMFEPTFIGPKERAIYATLLPAFSDNLMKHGIATAEDLEAVQRGLEDEIARDEPLYFCPFTQVVAMRPLHAG